MKTVDFPIEVPVMFPCPISAGLVQFFDIVKDNLETAPLCPVATI